MYKLDKPNPHLNPVNSQQWKQPANNYNVPSRSNNSKLLNKFNQHTQRAQALNAHKPGLHALSRSSNLAGGFDPRPSTTGQPMRHSQSTGRLGGNNNLSWGGQPQQQPQQQSGADSLLNRFQGSGAIPPPYSPSPSVNVNVNIPTAYTAEEAPPETSTSTSSSRRNSNPNNGPGIRFADDVVDNANANAQQQQQQQFSRPSTSQASMQSLPVDMTNTDNLREEVKRLQLAMIDQFRGKNKNRFTGGSQFRAKPASNEGADYPSRVELNGLRSTVKSLRGEMKLMKGEYEEMESSVEETNQRRYLIEEELRKEHMTCVNLKHQLDKMNGLLEKQMGSSKVNMEPTGMDLQMLEQRLKEALKQCDGLRDGKVSTARELKVKSEEIKELGQRRLAEKTRWEEERARLYAEIDQWRKRSKESLNALESNEAKSKKETSKIEEKLRRMSKTAVDKTSSKLKEKEDEIRRLAAEAEGLRSTHDKLQALEKEHKNERRKSQQMEGSLTDLREKLVGKEGEGEEYKVKFESANEKIIRLNEEIVGLSGICDFNDGKIEKLERRLREVEEDDTGAKEKDNLLEKLKSVTDELRTVGEEKNKVVKKLYEKIEEFGVLEARSARERKNHTSNMEQALNSIVRLCVVAPTVNVQMQEDKSMSFKAPLPKEKIRHFVQDQVLPKFAKIFAQPKDGCAPDGKANLDTWLQKVLVEMQQTIEKHLAKVFGGR